MDAPAAQTKKGGKGKGKGAAGGGPRKVKQEIYVSTDIEADGPIPGPNSMLNFGSAAFTADKQLVGTFSANLHVLPDAIPDPRTMDWWRTQPDAWNAIRTDLQDPEVAMKNYVAWLESLPGSPVFVGYPASYDFMFIYWYLMRFAGRSPFSFSALDIKSYAMAVLKKPFRETAKRTMPKFLFDGSPHTHTGLDDALEQGTLFCNLLNLNLNGSVLPRSPLPAGLLAPSRAGSSSSVDPSGAAVVVVKDDLEAHAPSFSDSDFPSLPAK
jgi:hypothetical protein